MLDAAFTSPVQRSHSVDGSTASAAEIPSVDTVSVSSRAMGALDA